MNEPLPYTLEPNQLLSFLVATAQEISFKLDVTQSPLDMTKGTEKSATPNKVSAVRRRFPVRAIDASEETDDGGLALTDGEYLYEVHRMVLDDSALDPDECVFVCRAITSCSIPHQRHHTVVLQLDLMLISSHSSMVGAPSFAWLAAIFIVYIIALKRGTLRDSVQVCCRHGLLLTF